MNSLKLLEKSPLSVGGEDLGIWKSTRMGCMSELGGSPLASSMAVMPSDQMSACRGGSHTLSTSRAHSARSNNDEKLTQLNVSCIKIGSRDILVCVSDSL